MRHFEDEPCRGVGEPEEPSEPPDFSGPWNEQQPLIDRLEGASDPFGDFAQGDDFSDDWTDE